LNNWGAGASDFATMNPAPLHAELSALRELVVSLKEALELSRQENTLLRQKVDSLVRRVFGASSERLDRAQLELLLQLPVPMDTDTTVPVVEVPKVSASRSERGQSLVLTQDGLGLLLQLEKPVGRVGPCPSSSTLPRSISMSFSYAGQSREMVF
jgi:hypothetical protein